ncbi:MAG: glycosyltransferase [Bacteroidetes bacterium]|nr:MAG: glycosyltransferase [Bacteroidota bacterium]
MKVSVLVKTFNHEQCIGQALESVLCQQADFSWELLVAEDCSTDGTREVVRAFGDRHGERVRLLLRERNLGPVGNFLDALAHCRGEYVALLDGDDYWTSPRKLQRQVDLLDARPGVSACTHDAMIVDSAGNPTGRRYCSARLPHELTLERVLEGNPVPACGLVFRRMLVVRLPDWFRALPFTDWALHLLLLEHGPIVYEPRCDAAYRQHAGGMWTALSERRRLALRIESYRAFERHFGERGRRIIRRRMARLYVELALAHARAGEMVPMRRNLRTALATAGPSLPRLLASRSVRKLVAFLLSRVAREGAGRPA